jgi:hypothetical protein
MPIQLCEENGGKTLIVHFSGKLIEPGATRIPRPMEWISQASQTQKTREVARRKDRKHATERE